MLWQACRTSRATASSPPGSRRSAGPKSITGIARVASSRLFTAMALKMFIVESPSPPLLGFREYPISAPNSSDLRTSPSPFEPGDHRVRPPDPAAQLAPQVGQEGDRDGMVIPHQRVKSILGEGVADRLLVEIGAGGEGGQPAPPALPRQLDPDADGPSRDQEEGPVEAVLLDDDFA